MQRAFEDGSDYLVRINDDTELVTAGWIGLGLSSACYVALLFMLLFSPCSVALLFLRSFLLSFLFWSLFSSFSFSNLKS